jgi:hypothetical protein
MILRDAYSPQTRRLHFLLSPPLALVLAGAIFAGIRVHGDFLIWLCAAAGMFSGAGLVFCLGNALFTSDTTWTLDAVNVRCDRVHFRGKRSESWGRTDIDRAEINSVADSKHPDSYIVVLLLKSGKKLKLPGLFKVRNDAQALLDEVRAACQIDRHD